MAKLRKTGVWKLGSVEEERAPWSFGGSGCSKFSNGMWNTKPQDFFPTALSVSVESVMRSMPDACRRLQTLEAVHHGSIANQALVNDAA